MAFSREFEAFRRVMEAPPDERAAAALESAGGDRGLAERALELFDRAGRRDPLLDEPVPALLRGSIDARAPRPLLPGYDLEEELGRGGQGVVYRARHLALDRLVALKVLHPALERDDVVSKRFEREGRVAARIEHAGVVRVLDVGSRDGVAFLAMELLTGETLATLIDRLRRGRDDGAAWRADRRLTELFAPIAGALDAAHREGLIHRDLKPSNIMLVPGRGPVIVDFGVVHDAVAGTRLTVTGGLLGAPAYVAPEIIDGAEEAVSRQADIYSLGVMMYELATLRLPYDAVTREALYRAVLSGGAPPAHEIEPSVPRALSRVIGVAMDRDPNRRYESAGALEHDLRCVADGARPQVAPALVRRGAAWVGRHALLAGIALAVAAFIAAAAWAARDRQSSLLERADSDLRASEQKLDEVINDVGEAQRRLRAGWVSGGVSSLERGIRVSRSSLKSLWKAADHSIELARRVSEAGAAERRRQLLAQQIELEFVENHDVSDRERVSRLIRKLLESGGDDRFLHDLGREDQIRLTSSTPATVVVTRYGSDARVDGGPTPLELTLDEGSYVAVVERERGEAVRVPFVVRRPDAYGASDEPAASELREVHIDLTGLDGVGDDGGEWIYVPAGWSLLGREVLYWKKTDSFWIKKYETTVEEWLTYTKSPWLEGSKIRRHDFLPWDASRPDGFLIDEETNRHVVDGLRVPIRSISRQAAKSYALRFSNRDARSLDRWRVDLPTFAEWQRAARGADGRPYPWGTEPLELPADSDAEKWAPIVGSSPDDVSPFGVRDMSGGVREWTRSAGSERTLTIVAGGSYRSVTPRQRQVSAMSEVENHPQWDVGLRLIRRRAPRWSRDPADVVPRVDDFERPDGDDLGRGWHAFEPLRFGRLLEGERCRLEGGRLVLQGGVGNYSNNAWVAGKLGLGAFKLRVRGRVGCEKSAKNRRVISIVFCESPFADREPGLTLTLRLDAEGSPLLLLATDSRGGPDLVPARWQDMSLEIDVRGHTASATATWPGGGATLSSDLPDPTRQYRFVALMAHNYIGARFEIDEVRLDPLE